MLYYGHERVGPVKVWCELQGSFSSSCSSVHPKLNGPTSTFMFRNFKKKCKWFGLICLLLEAYLLRSDHQTEESRRRLVVDSGVVTLFILLRSKLNHRKIDGCNNI